MRTPPNLLGKRFERLLVMERAPPKEGLRRPAVSWRCVCDCGNEIVVPTGRLHNGHTKSCGCLAVEIATIHSESYNPEYMVWRSMINRCNRPSQTAYEVNQERGIQVSKPWRESIHNFIRDMGRKPTPTSRLRRKDKTKGYGFDNCEWHESTRKSHAQTAHRSIRVSCTESANPRIGTP